MLLVCESALVPRSGYFIAIMVTGFTGYPITAGPFSQKIVRLIFNATYSSVTTGKYLIIFRGLGEKNEDRELN